MNSIAIKLTDYITGGTLSLTREDARHLLQQETGMTMADEQIKHMVNRFLMWRLPENFNPDCGIHFDADAAKKLNSLNHRYEPVGTNLFDADQATAMVRYMVDGLPKTEV